MKSNNYNKEFANYIRIIGEALKNEDFDAYNSAKMMLDEAVSEKREFNELKKQLNTLNFGILNHIFEEELPTLIKTNKKGVRAVIALIKEDKNLVGQFNLYNVIKTKYNGNAAKMIDSSEMLDKLVESAEKDIDSKTLLKSNKKLRNVMIENNIVPSKFISSEDKNLYEAIDNIITSKRSTSNMVSLMENYHTVCQYMDAHKDDNKSKGKTFDEIVEEFEKNLKDNLNESEISFVQEITDFRTPLANKRKERLFNEIKTQCLGALEKMLKEDTSNEELSSLKEQISGMAFNNETIVNDIAKLMEIRDILVEE